MIRIIVALLLSAIALSPAFAQYQWRDAKGRMVFSDMPPPQGIAKSRIIKGFAPKPRPKSVQDAADEAATNVAAERASEVEPSAPETPSTEARLAKRLAEFNKRREAKAKSDAETDAKTKQATRNRELCRNLQADNRALTSGMRLARMNEKGEREVISESAKRTRLKENKQLIAKHCKA